MEKKTQQLFVTLVFVFLFIIASYLAGMVAAGKDAGFCQIVFILGVLFGLVSYYLVDLIGKKYGWY